MANLVASFGKDYFIIDSSAYPEFIVTSGYEDCVLVNGVSLSKLMSGEVPFDGSVFVSVDKTANTHIVRLENSYDPNGQYYIAPDSSDQLLRSESTIPGPTIDSSLFIVKNIPPKISYIRDIKYAFANGDYKIYQTLNGNYLYHIHIDSSTSFGFALGQKNNDGTRTDASYCSISYNPGETNEQKYEKVQKMIDNNTSYELLRANPKLTGNVKVVVDSKSDIYLDTFKVSKGLSQRKYRKIKLNPDEYYGTSLMSKMSSLSSDDFYKVEDTCYSIFALANSLGDQYYDKYNSGVRTNDDRMYSENYSILAPLCIKKTMPDFFLVFKIKNYEKIDNSAERLKYFLSNGTLVKAFDLRKDSNAGKLMRKVYEHSKDFVGDLFVSYDYDLDNVYNGISLDRGVVSNIHESASLERYIKNQVAMNDWYTLGFERNRIVSKNIVNFEFMFDDPEEELFSVNTYFGLYVRLNGEETDFSCIGVLSDKTPVFDDSVSGSSFNPSLSSNLDIIYGMSTTDDFKRLRTNITSKNSYSDIQDYISKPYKNIASPELIQMSDDIYNKSFASVTVNTVMDVGEHYRIVDFSNYKIYEVVLSNYKDEEFDISEVNCYEKEMMNKTFSIERVTVYGIPYRQIILTGSDAYVAQTRQKEIQLIVEAFNSFGDDIINAYASDDSFAVIYNKHVQNGVFDIIMEKVSSFIGMSHDEIQTKSDYNDDSTSFFDDSNIDKIILRAADTGKKEVLYPSGFEALGDRICYCYSFVPFESNGNKIYMLGESVEIKLSKEKTVIFDTSVGYAVAKPFKIYAVNEDFTLRAKSVWNIPGFGEEGSYLMRFEKEPDSVNGRIHFYNLYPINAGICSIFPVKDIMTNVLDATNKISTEQSDYISSTGGEFSSRRNKNVFDKVILPTDEENIMHYFDKMQRFTSYKTSTGEVKSIQTLNSENLTGYLSALNTGNHKYSDLSILYPCCCKWKVLGSDARGDSMRVMYTYQTTLKNNSYFIPDENEAYIGALTVSDGKEVGISGSKYGSFDSCTGGFPKYINSNLDPRTHPLFREFLFSGNGSLDDIIHNDLGDSNGIMSSAYTNGKDSVEFISGGLKMRIRSNNVSIFDVSKYNGYSALLICCSGNNPERLNPCEVLIDEIHEQIAVIIYNGSAPWQMFYNDHDAKRTVNGEVRIPVVYPVFHKTSLNECTTTYLEFGTEMRKSVLVSDDSSMWGHDASVQLVSSSDGLSILLSPVIDQKSFIRDKNAVLVGKVDNTASFNEICEDDTIAVFDSSLYIDSSYASARYSTFKNQLNKVNECVDMFVISDLPSKEEAIEDNVIDEYDTDYATLPLEILRTFLDTATLTVKTANGTDDYSAVNGLFTLNIVDPVEVVREDSEFIKLNEEYPLEAHSAYVEPVTQDIISFRYNDDNINYQFGKSFDGCNIHVDGIKTLDQIWLKKFSHKPLTSGSRKVITQTITSTMVDFDIPYSSLSVQQISTDIVKDDILKDNTDSSYGGGNGRYIVTNDASLNKEYSVLSLTLSCDWQKNNYEFVQVNGSFYFDNNDSSKYTIKRIVDSSIERKTENGANFIKYIFVTVEFQEYPLPSVSTSTEVTLTNGGIDFNILPDGIVYAYKIYGILHTRLLSGDLPNTSATDIHLLKEAVSSDTFDASLGKYEDVTTKETIRGNITSTTGFSVLHGLSPIVDCWHTNMYRTFTDLDTYTSNNGINSGFEKNIFFASHGINLKSESTGEFVDYIDITIWKNTVINKAKRVIILDITESLINKIMYSSGYLSNWSGQRITEPADKRRYIENSILPLIDINENCTFEFYESPITTNKITMNNFLISDIEKTLTSRVAKKSIVPAYKKLENLTNTLYKKNNKYYMRIEGLNSYAYSAKMRINL